MAEAISKAAEERLKRFVKHINIASQRSAQREKAKRVLQAKISKLKRLLGKKGVKKETIATALAEFDNKLDDILSKEGRILLKQKKEKVTADRLKEEIELVRGSLSKVEKHDIGIIEALTNQIKGFESELRQTEQSRKQETDEILKMVQDLRIKIDDLVNVRGKRLEELEEKIKSREGRNYQELLNIEKQIREMEARYEAAKRAGVPEESLGKLKEKMTAMKEKVGAKKEEMEMPVEQPPFRVPKGTLMIKPPKEKPRIPMKKKPLIKHEVMFGVPPKAAVPAEEELPMGIPPLPGIPEPKASFAIPPPPPPPPGLSRPAAPPKKRGFFARLFGR